jgi:hypothetical protein
VVRLEDETIMTYALDELPKQQNSQKPQNPKIPKILQKP